MSQLGGQGGTGCKKSQVPHAAGFQLLAVHPEGAACTSQLRKLKLGRGKPLLAWPQQGAASIPLGIWGCPSLWHASVGCDSSPHKNNPSGVTCMHSQMTPLPRTRASKCIQGKQTLFSTPDFSILQTPGVSQGPKPLLAENCTYLIRGVK